MSRSFKPPSSKSKPATLPRSDPSSWGTLEDIVRILVAGDLLEFQVNGGLYQHWAVYIAEEKMVHVGSSLGSNSKQVKKRFTITGPGKVYEESVWNYTGEKCRLNNQRMKAALKGLTALPSKKIVENAKRWIGMRMEYHLLSNNCEFFATSCRYGEAFCHQV